MRTILFMQILPVVLAFLAATRLLSAQMVVVKKPEFRALVAEDAVVEKLAGGFKFLEGPTWNPVDHFLMFSDIPADTIYKLDPATNATSVFRRGCGQANGNRYDAQGNLWSCEHATHRVLVLPRDGTMVRIIAEQYGGKALSSPNDVAIRSDGTVWFTDPTYGLGKRQREQETNNVYRYDPKARELCAVGTDFEQPNGICFSPDEKLLYIADSGKPRDIRVFDVTADNQLTNGRVFCAIDHGVPDGIRCDAAGNLWSSAGDGVQVFNPAGERLGRILVPESPANLAFGAVDPQGKSDLYITARTSLYRVKVMVDGAAVR